jgi:hypothetical protein
MIFFQKCKILRLTYDFKSQTVITTKKKNCAFSDVFTVTKFLPHH